MIQSSENQTFGRLSEHAEPRLSCAFPKRFVILRLPQPPSEHSERDAAEDGEGSPGALLGAEANCDFCNDPGKRKSRSRIQHKPLLRFCPSLRILRSFAVLRAFRSLRSLSAPAASG